MHCTVESGNNTILRVLLAAGVNPNVIEGCGISLLHLAALGKSIVTAALRVTLRDMTETYVAVAWDRAVPDDHAS